MSEENNKETIEISSINGTSFYDAEKVLVTLEDSKESMICYLAIVNNNQFHDCDVLNREVCHPSLYSYYPMFRETIL